MTVDARILQLEPHDDAISTRDKMDWEAGGRILLVWPARGRILTRRLDLVLLQRRSQSLGAQLALATKDPEVLAQARSLGIPAFRNVRRALNARWKRPARPKTARKVGALEARARLAAPRPHSTPRELPLATRLGFFAAGILAVTSIAASIFPSAEIRLVPDTRPQQLEMQARALASAERASLSGVLPLRSARVVVTGRDSLEPSGTAPLPDQAARGQVRFTNLTERPMTIPAGTVVSAPGSGARYATEREGCLPAGIGQNALLPVRALLPGSAGNLPAGRIQAIEGTLGASLAVTNPEPVRGGSDRPSPAPTSLDQERLYARLLATLSQSALAELQASLEPGDLLLTPQPLLTGVLEKAFDPPGRQPAPRLELTLRLEFEARLVSWSDLENLAASLMDADLPPGYSPVPGTLAAKALSEPAWLGETAARLELRFSRLLRAQIPESQAVSRSLGLSPEGARRRLVEELPLASPPIITLRPSWWPRLPLLPFRIGVIRSP